MLLRRVARFRGPPGYRLNVGSMMGRESMAPSVAQDETKFLMIVLPPARI